MNRIGFQITVGRIKIPFFIRLSPAAYERLSNALAAIVAIVKPTLFVLTVIAGLVIPLGMIHFFTNNESALAETPLIEVLLFVVLFIVVGIGGVTGGTVLSARGSSRGYGIALLSGIIASIASVVAVMVMARPPLTVGWWATYLVANLGALFTILELVIHGRENPQHGLLRVARKNALQLGIIAVLYGLWVFYILAAPDTYLSGDIYAAFMMTIPFFGIVALPLTMVVITGEIDLSFSSVMAMGTVMFIQVFERTYTIWEFDFVLSILLAFGACLLTGFLIGLLNGLLIVRVGIPSLIATIGTQFFWRGMVNVIREGRSGVLVDPKNSFLGDILVGRVAGIPLQFVWFVLIAIVVWLVLNRHKFGAHIYLSGDNENSARLMGVNVDRTKIMVFVIVGVAAAFVGLIASLHVSNFFTTLGEGHLMTTLSSVFLGGTSVFGGSGTILGTFAATFIIGSIKASTVAVGLTGFWVEVIYGLIITLSVAMHSIMRRRMA